MAVAGSRTPAFNMATWIAGAVRAVDVAAGGHVGIASHMGGTAGPAGAVTDVAAVVADITHRVAAGRTRRTHGTFARRTGAGTVITVHLAAGAAGRTGAADSTAA